MSLAYRPDIDGLRAVAVGSVVLFHANFPPFKGGFVGVDVFFVISGYLITSIIAAEMAQDRFSLIDFYDRRIRRILPALFVVLAGTAALSAFVLLPSQMEEFARSLAPSALFFANVHFMGLQSYFAPAVEEMPLLHVWSLAVEEQFYIVFPLLLLGLMRFSGRRGAIGLLVVIALISLAYAQRELAEDPRRAFFLLSSRAWELLVGALLALAPLPRLRPGTAAALGAVGLAGILAPVFLYSKATSFPGIAALPPVLGAAFIIYAGRHAPQAPVARLLSLPPVVYIGRISYSLYLWHWPLLALAFVYKGRSLTHLQSAGLVALAVLLSALSLRYVEMPARRATAFGGRRAMHFAAGAALILVTVLGAKALEAIDGRLWPMTPRAVLADAALRESRFPRDCELSGSFVKGAVSCLAGPAAAGGAYDVLVWGDSHAGANFVGFAERFAAQGLTTRLLRFAGCPPLVGGLATRNGDPGQRCAAFNDAVLEEIGRAKPKLVILIGRWAMWTALAHHNMALTVPALETSRAPSGEGSRAAFPVLLERTLKEVRARGPNVLVLGQAPEFAVSPPRCVARSEYLGAAEANCMAQSRKEAMRLLAFADAELLRAVRDVPGASALLLTDLFCGPLECRAGDEGAFFYRDSDHLSQTGARMIRDDPRLKAAIEQLLPAGRNIQARAAQ